MRSFKHFGLLLLAQAQTDSSDFGHKTLKKNLLKDTLKIKCHTPHITAAYLKILETNSIKRIYIYIYSLIGGKTHKKNGLWRHIKCKLQCVFVFIYCSMSCIRILILYENVLNRLEYTERNEGFPSSGRSCRFDPARFLSSLSKKIFPVLTLEVIRKKSKKKKTHNGCSRLKSDSLNLSF